MWIETARTPRESPALINLDHVHQMEVGRTKGGAYEVFVSHPGGQTTLSSWTTCEEAEAFLEVLRDKIQAISNDAVAAEAVARRARGSLEHAPREEPAEGLPMPHGAVLAGATGG